MNNIEEIHKTCKILDLLGASKTQFVFVSEKDFENRYGFIEQTTKSACIIFQVLDTSYTLPTIASLMIDGFNFVFIDPSKIS